MGYAFNDFQLDTTAGPPSVAQQLLDIPEILYLILSTPAPDTAHTATIVFKCVAHPCESPKLPCSLTMLLIAVWFVFVSRTYLWFAVVLGSMWCVWHAGGDVLCCTLFARVSPLVRWLARHIKRTTPAAATTTSPPASASDAASSSSSQRKRMRALVRLVWVLTALAVAVAWTRFEYSTSRGMWRYTAWPAVTSAAAAAAVVVSRRQKSGLVLLRLCQVTAAFLLAALLFVVYETVDGAMDAWWADDDDEVLCVVCRTPAVLC